MKKVFAILMVPVFLGVAVVESQSQTAENIKPVALPADKIQKIQNASKSVLRARFKSRDEEAFKKDKELLKAFRQTLEEMKGGLQATGLEPDKLDLNVPTPGSTSPKVKNNKKKKSLTKKQRLQRKSARLNTASQKIQLLEANFQKRKIAKKIKRAEKKLARLQGNTDAKAIKKVTKLEKKLKRLKKRKAKIESTGSPLRIKSKKSSKKIKDPDMTPSKDETSRMTALVEELEMITKDNNPDRQQKKMDRLLKRTGVSEEMQVMELGNVQPSISTRTQHR